jgi:predicted PurR-regulated permease PerM
VLQAIDLYHTAEPQLRDVMQRGDAGMLGKLKATALGQWVLSFNIEWDSLLRNLTQSLGGTAGKLINTTSRLTFGIVIDVFVILFSMFYFFRDGEQILSQARAFIPLSEEYKDLLISRFSTISSATVKGVLLIALIQSSLGTLTLWVFGVESWLLWGGVMLVFSVIPFVGTGAVMIPAGIINILSGNVWQGAAIIVISIFIVSTIDNVLRPRLVGHQAGMHDLMVFFSTIGGLTVFGPSGFIIGPLIAAIFLTVLDIYSIEFRDHIAYPRTSVPVPPPPLPESDK